MMALGILNTMVKLLWQYLRYLSNEANFSSTMITFDRLYTFYLVSSLQCAAVIHLQHYLLGNGGHLIPYSSWYRLDNVKTLLGYFVIATLIKWTLGNQDSCKVLGYRGKGQLIYYSLTSMNPSKPLNMSALVKRKHKFGLACLEDRECSIQE